MKKLFSITLFAVAVILSAGSFPGAAEAATPYIDYVTARQGDGTYVAGNTIELQIYFSEPVYSSNATLYLNTSRSCSFSAYNQTSASCFYTVQSGDYTSRLNVTSVSGSFTNSSGQTMTNGMPMRNLDQYRNIQIGSQYQGNPYIVSVTTSRPDGTYGAGQTIDLIVDFSEAVQSDSVTLYLNTSRSCTFSIYNSSRATCNYNVQSGDYASPLRVTSISGSIRDTSGWSVTDFMPRANLDAYRQIRIGTGSSYYDPYTPVCPYNYNSYNNYNSYPYGSSYCNYGGQPTIEELVRQLTALRAQVAALIAANDTQVAVVSPPIQTIQTVQAGQVLGAFTVHLAFPVSAIYRDLAYGMTGEDVGVLQGVLTAEGYYVPPTGYFGPKTYNALLSLQRRIGYPQTGVFDAGMRQWAISRGY